MNLLPESRLAGTPTHVSFRGISPRRLLRRIAGCGLAGLITVSGLRGQELSTPESSSENDFIILSPFEVDASQDVGYRSTNSISGTSLNTKIKDLPMSIEVINEEFISDIGATNFEEALQYSAGVSLEDYAQPTASGTGSNGLGVNVAQSADQSASSRGGLGGRFDNGINIRGFNVPFQNRDGFRYGGLIANYGVVLGGILDTSNVSRMEVVRGPNSLLYGIGVLSGIVNVIPKRPLSEPSQSYSLGFGNFGYMRGTVDFTGPIKKDLWGGDLSYRVGAAFEHRDNWTDFNERDLQYYTAQLQFKNDRWSVFVEGQFADRKDHGIGARFIYDASAAAIDETFRNEYGEHINWQKDFAGLPESYRITGPDTYDQRKEYDFLATVDFTPTENLAFSAGAFITDSSEERFDVNIGTLTNEFGGFQLKDVLIPRASDPNTDPAIAAQVQEFIDTTVYTRPFEGTPLPGDQRDLTDHRIVRYWWRKRPEDSLTQQYRFRGTYTLETKDILGGEPMKHTFLLGYHYIKDEADIVIGSENINNQFTTRGELADNDPLLLRSVFNNEPIRYNGEKVAQPGSEYRNLQVWYSGYYGLYQGWFLDQKLGVILGLRRDRYHARDRLYDRYEEPNFNPERPLHNAPAGVIIDNPDNKTYGFLPAPEGVEVQEYRPGPDPEYATSKTLALNYRLWPSLTGYFMRGEGITPNTGALDGDGKGIESERTVSEELGLKFELFEGKLSGTVGVYRITRENALWNLASAPVPIDWVGPPDRPGVPPRERDGSFDPSQITPATPLNYNINNYYLAQDGIELGKVTTLIYDDAGRVIGRNIDFPPGYLGQILRGSRVLPQTYVFFDYDKLDEPVIDRFGNTNGKTWRHYMEVAFADRGRSSTAGVVLGGPEDFDPITNSKEQGTFLGNSPSIGSATGANVTYTDEAKGVDLQLLYQPTKNLQFVFTYSHTERQAITPFDLAEVIDQQSGVQYGTEYDEWVRILGRAAFGLEEHDDDGDGVVDRVTKAGESNVLKVGDVPTSSLVGGLQGLSLFLQPEDSASIFSKYTFTEGRLKGLAPSIGLNYIGPAATSIPIGGADLAENRFRTPETAARFVLNLGCIYRWRGERGSYKVQLNVNNVLDDQKGETIIDYFDDSTPIQRRTTSYYGPRSFRLSFTATF